MFNNIDLTKVNVGDLITIKGKISIKDDKRTDNLKSRLMVMTVNDQKVYARATSPSKEFDIAKNIENGNIVTITGELKKIPDSAKNYYFMGIDELAIEEAGALNRTQIIREDAKSSFLEVMDATEIEKVRINFIKYDTTKSVGSRYTNNISIYLDIADADYFAEAILNGFYESKIKAEKLAVKAGKKSYPDVADEFFGGTPASTLAARGQARKDGKSLARIMSVEASSSDRYVFCLVAQQGPGTVGTNGSIVASRKDMEEKVQIPLSLKAAIRLARAIRRHLDAYETANAVAKKIKGE